MRDQFIPVRKSDIAAALAGDPRLADDVTREAFRQLCRVLGLIFRYESFDELEALKDAYFRFNPQIAEKVSTEDSAAYAAFMERFGRVLAKGNFIEVPRAEIEASFHRTGLVPVEVHTPIEQFRDVRFFRRGMHRESIEVADWWGYRVRRIEADVYDEVVMVVAMKPAIAAAYPRRSGRRRRKAPGGVLIKYFRDTASADLNTLLPDVKVVMRPRDKWLLGLPALFGGIPLILKLAPTLAILLVLLGVRLGGGEEPATDRLQQALIVFGGFIALGSFATHQWLKYQRQTLRYQLDINEAIYFRNLTNNAGIFDVLVGSADDQEMKEALLAYFFLRDEPMEEDALDRRIEAWLKERFGVNVDFEVDDGIAKLERLGLLTRAPGSSGNAASPLLSVVPLAEALARLDRLWDGYFNYDVGKGLRSNSHHRAGRADGPVLPPVIPGEPRRGEGRGSSIREGGERITPPGALLPLASRVLGPRFRGDDGQ